MSRPLTIITLLMKLAQLPTTMSSLEVLQTFLFQTKDFVSTLCVLNPLHARLITFYLDKAKPHLPPLVAFQILVMIKNIIVHLFIINEGASTCIMSMNS